MHPDERKPGAEDEPDGEELPLFRPEVTATQERFFGEVVRLPRLSGLSILWAAMAVAIVLFAASYAGHVDAVHLIHWLFQRS